MSQKEIAVMVVPIGSIMADDLQDLKFKLNACAR